MAKTEPSDSDVPRSETDLERLTREELIAMCKSKLIAGYSGRTKAKIVELIRGTAGETDKKLEAAPEQGLFASPNVADSVYVVGDALDLLATDTNHYKCIYLDPPYASGRDYKFAEADTTASFTDRLSADACQVWLSKLVKLCKARLAKDGTLWFHIAAEYSFVPELVLRAEFSAVEKNFWKRAHGKNGVRNKTGAVVDILFRCTNGTPVFNVQYVPLDAHYFEQSYRNKDTLGLYALGSLRFDKTRSGHRYEVVHEGLTYSSPYGWKVSQDAMTKLIQDDRAHFVKPSGARVGNIYKKLYKHECKGKPLSNLWDDISYITRTQQDPRTYPTQKPLKLLQRIVAMSTNEGDLVLDPTAGSGTTGVACLSLGRRCVQLDINKDAKAVFERRIGSVEKIKKSDSVDLRADSEEDGDLGGHSA